ncbi:TetR/AcrR family transcriptional regulator [Oceanitalea stevensii]|uniref:TetR family transcriptional regulator C-terminal domain-containing protein n=1 Tax=Oceanitalea stevensii TaxID=2763072 RepID=A0ABR8Z1Y0_9MICO|nr:TetR family transcriptional regulator C-terminal domain-containing protein [Oceanitalea stevensii]MBD8062336.1 TetR family transcriptional regulator C-terminal domain-containing protein [Oceanitalea stevensii]
MTSSRDRALGAAIELVGTQGLKALTHRRIDERAQLPPGSTSNYFRTRGALISAVAEAILERELAGMGATFAPRSAEDLIEALVALLVRTTEDQRVQTTARLTLFMEASHDPALRQTLGEGRAVLEAALKEALGTLGASDAGASARAIMACAEGLILHRVARHDDADVRPVVELVVRAALR